MNRFPQLNICSTILVLQRHARKHCAAAAGTGATGCKANHKIETVNTCLCQGNCQGADRPLSLYNNHHRTHPYSLVSAPVIGIHNVFMGTVTSFQTEPAFQPGFSVPELEQATPPHAPSTKLYSPT
jgi:hypothetical protein